MRLNPALMFLFAVGSCAGGSQEQRFEFQSPRTIEAATSTVSYGFMLPNGVGAGVVEIGLISDAEYLRFSYANKELEVRNDVVQRTISRIDLDTVGVAETSIDDQVCYKIYYEVWDAQLTTHAGSVAVDLCSDGGVRVIVADKDGDVEYLYDSKDINQ